MRNTCLSAGGAIWEALNLQVVGPNSRKSVTESCLGKLYLILSVFPMPWFFSNVRSNIFTHFQHHNVLSGWMGSNNHGMNLPKLQTKVSYYYSCFCLAFGKTTRKFVSM